MLNLMLQCLKKSEKIFLFFIAFILDIVFVLVSSALLPSFVISVWKLSSAILNHDLKIGTLSILTMAFLVFIFIGLARIFEKVFWVSVVSFFWLFLASLGILLISGLSSGGWEEVPYFPEILFFLPFVFFIPLLMSTYYFILQNFYFRKTVGQSFINKNSQLPQGCHQSFGNILLKSILYFFMTFMIEVIYLHMQEL